MTVAPTSAHPQRLFELLSKISFGRIEGLIIRNGQPILDPLPRIVREIKFGSEISTCAPINRSISVPKRQLQELIGLMHEIKDGVIDVLEIRHGLPFRVVIAESPARLGGA